MPQWLVQIAPAILSLVLLAAALYVLHIELGALDGDVLSVEIDSLTWMSLAGAVALTALSYFLLTVNEAFGLRYAGKMLPYARAAFVSFISYSFAHNLGLNLLTGGSIRYRMYATNGLNGLDVAAVTAYCGVAFAIGSLTLAAIALIGEPQSVLMRLEADPSFVHLLGILILVGVAGYFALSLTVREPVSIMRWSITMPGPAFAAAQIFVGATDMIVSAGIVYVLMPPDIGMGFAAFAGIYTIATWAGLISHVPGGAGVFEAVMVLLLPNVPKEQLIASLLAYRAIYYILPLVLASATLAVAEFVENRERIDRLAATVERRVAPILAPLLGLLVFLGGAVLLLSGATPAIDTRMEVLKAILPLPLIEMSHLAGSLAGTGLLLLSRGLFRRLDGAYFLSLIVLTIGIVVSLLKGLDFEEAIVLAIILGLLLLSRSAFYRQSNLFTEPFTLGWVASIAAALAGTTWVGFFAYRDVEYANDRWLNFAFEGDAQRFLRASIVIAVAAVGIALWRLLAPTAPRARKPSEADLDTAWPVAAAAGDTLAQLVMLGDKNLLLSQSRKSFLMYAVRGSTWVALGAPVGDPAEASDLAWRFREMCDASGGRPVFYQVTAQDLPLCLDLGLSAVKIGEEAHVPLENFTLEGRKNKDLRTSRNRAQREGMTFEIVPQQGVVALLPELKAVSDAWLSEQKAAEKGFSLGFFSEPYLSRMPVAIVRHEGQIVAFANLLVSGDHTELSVDLMRHRSDAPHGVMDFLFAEIMLWGAAHGFKWFNLGMAPLSGLQDRPLAPLWHRAGALIFRHGETFYNFEGLRRYKEKFNPVWRPRYFVSAGGLSLPTSLLDATALISGGMKELVTK